MVLDSLVTRLASRKFDSLVTRHAWRKVQAETLVIFLKKKKRK